MFGQKVEEVNTFQGRQLLEEKEHEMIVTMSGDSLESAVGMQVKQGKGGGVSAYPEIAADFRLWLDPAERLAIVRLTRNVDIDSE